MSVPVPVKPILLGVNIDHCATIRQARYPGNPKAVQAEPNPLQFALLCEAAGADGITMHLREDRRHVQAFDVEAVRAAIKTRLNLEMACTEEMIGYALQIEPASVCLVPEKREEITTEGGLDLIKHFDRSENAKSTHYRRKCKVLPSDQPTIRPTDTADYRVA